MGGGGLVGGGVTEKVGRGQEEPSREDPVQIPKGSRSNISWALPSQLGLLLSPCALEQRLQVLSLSFVLCQRISFPAYED